MNMPVLSNPPRLAVTGFVAADAGSVTSSNSLVLGELLRRGYTVDFFGKPSFVYPAEHARHARFRYVDATNRRADSLRRWVQRRVGGPPAFAAALADTWTYNRGITAAIRREHCRRPYDLRLVLGDHARGKIDGLPTVSWVQGPPGTDARSIIERREEVTALAGRATALRLTALANVRLAVGLPRYKPSDLLIVGSAWSRQMLVRDFHQPGDRVHALPYAIDLTRFECCKEPHSRCGSLQVCWLGRIVPRKRIDLLLKAAGLAIRRGVDLTLNVVGDVGFVPGYDRPLSTFEFPDRLRHRRHADRSEIPALLQTADVLVQPSDEENFGSSVAEALACGTPAIVGATNGTGDYVCQRSTRLTDDRPETLAAALADYAERKRAGRLRNPRISRTAAEQHFDVKHVVDGLEAIVAKLTPAITAPNFRALAPQSLVPQGGVRA